MKKLLLSIALLGTVSAFATPKFSAFSDGEKLHITVLGDSCNHVGATLKVAKYCQASRMTRNYAPTCEADLQVSMTELFCGDEVLVPVTITLNLSEEDVTKEAKQLTLNYAGDSIVVLLDNRLEMIDHKAIYNALTVEAVEDRAMPDSIMADKVKRVGGLTCGKFYVGEGFLYNCEMQGERDDKAIYEALGIEAVPVNPGIAGMYKMEKSVGGLSCTLSKLVYPQAKPNYSCSL